MPKYLKQILILITIFIFIGIIAFGASYIWGNGSGNKPGDKSQTLTVNIDKAVIIKQSTELSRLVKVQEIVQRDVEITLDLGGFKIFDRDILDNKRTQKTAITGYAEAGIDLAKLKPEDVNITATPTGKKLSLKLPAPEIFTVNILEDKLSILKDDLTLLFQTSTLIDGNKRREANEFLQRQVLKQGKLAVADGSCQNQILNKVNTSSQQFMTSWYKSLGFEQVEVIITTPQSCGYVEIGS